ncbi:MFS transporter [Patescibacteria group bacterium]|nr:MFS transporter [Patescibacteria group bacterium]
MHLSERLGSRAGKTDSLISMYWNVLLRGLGMSMLGLFVPIYIYKIGADWGGMIGGLQLVAGYMLIQRLLIALVTIWVGGLVNKLSFRWSVLLGSFLTVLYYLLPSLIDGSLMLVVAMALITSFSIPFYWLSRLSILAVDGEHKSFGKEMGIVTLLERGGAILAPVVGGVVAQVFGFKTLFAVGVVIISVSTVPLFYMKHHQHDGGVSWAGFKSWFKDIKNRHLVMSFVGEGMDGFVTSFYWPLYIFLMIGSLEVLGGLISVTMFFSVLTVLLASRWFDKKRAVGGKEDEKMFWWFGGLFAVTRVLRAGFGNLIGLFSIDLVTKLIAPLYWIPFGGYVCSAGKKAGGLRFYVYREVVYSLAIVVVSGVVLLVLGFGWRWWGIFGLSAFGVLLTMKLAKES